MMTRERDDEKSGLQTDAHNRVDKPDGPRTTNSHVIIVILAASTVSPVVTPAFLHRTATFSCPQPCQLRRVWMTSVHPITFQPWLVLNQNATSRTWPNP